MNTAKYLIVIVVLFASCSPKLSTPLIHIIQRADDQFSSYIRNYPDSTMHPRSVHNNDSIYVTTSRNWTSGFFAGNLWYMYALTGDDKWRSRANAWTVTLESERLVTSTHDLGFILNNSYGLGYRFTKNEAYKPTLLIGAHTLSKRFSPIVGAIRSWDFPPYTYPVIVDNLMNLEYLMWAFKATGDSNYYRIVKSHTDTDKKHRFRADNSTYHVLDFDPATGKLLKSITRQGLADESCWSRGQAWAIYGYTMLYREFGDTAYLNQAKKAADYFLQQTKKVADRISYWDFNDPSIPNAPRDASASAVAASGMLELSLYSGKKSSRYYKAAIEILNSLSGDNYLAAPNTNHFFLLKHSVGNKPEKTEIDKPLVYADYYFLEALWRYKQYPNFLK